MSLRRRNKGSRDHRVSGTVPPRAVNPKQSGVRRALQPAASSCTSDRFGGFFLPPQSGAAQTASSGSSGLMEFDNNQRLAFHSRGFAGSQAGARTADNLSLISHSRAVIHITKLIFFFERALAGRWVLTAGPAVSGLQNTAVCRSHAAPNPLNNSYYAVRDLGIKSPRI